MISNESLVIPFDNPEVYLNLMRVISTKEFGSIRPIAFRSYEGNSTVISADDAAFTTADAFINSLTDAHYAGAPFEGITSATLSNKSEYSLSDLTFSGDVTVDKDSKIMVVSSKCDFVVYFRYGKGYYSSQENASFLASQLSSLEMKGLVPFASNHNIVNSFTFVEHEGKYEVSLDAKDNTTIKDVLLKLQENVNSIKIA